MNNYNNSIYCDKNTELTSELIINDILLNIPNVLNDIKNVDKNIRYVDTRYVLDFAYYTNDTIIGKSLEYYGEYTELEIQLLYNFIDSDYIVYDIGSNIGYHTVAFANKAKHVYAFEPNKKNLKLLQKNVSKFKNVTVYDVACSNHVGKMHVEDFDLDKPGNYGEMHMLDTGQECDSIKVDDLEIYAPDLIKIDVEGHELQVLLGAMETIKEYKPKIFYEAHGNDLDLIYKLLTELDYRLYWFPCSNYNQNNYRKNQVNIFGNGGVLNILAVHNMPKIGNLLEVKYEQTFSECVNEYLQSQKK